ncbi:MAG TPA: ABC transporter substrate-binding protein [Streptosporangiaceae bacterium]|jgi:multiple sugar transport system substrate-binding protein
MIVMHDHQARSPRRAQPRILGRSARGRLITGMVVCTLGSSMLAACGSSGGGSGSGPVTLNFYDAPDTSGATQKVVNDCSAQGHGKYTISYQQLSTSSDLQRQQMARRLAARDNSIDILGLDVTWEAEFAEAGWIAPWAGVFKQEAETGTLKPALDTAIWHNQLVAVPDNSNTQLLWYRSDLVKTPPTTWAQMFADSAQLAKEGKPHLIEIQGAQYEGITVWFNTLLTSAGGSVLNGSDTKATLGAPAVKALSIMHQLATSNAADPSLDVQEENDNRLAMEAGTAAFELNYPFVYPAMKSDNPTLFKSFKWAPYPEVIPGKPASVTIGGTDLAVSSYSLHKSLAFQAALCLRDKASQLISATVGGLPPTLASLYSDPAMFSAYPFHADTERALATASVRPKTPEYQIVSIAISHLVSPPGSINPASTEKSMVSQVNNALQEKGLVP